MVWPTTIVSSISVGNLPICEHRTACGGGGAAPPKNGSQDVCRLGGPSSVGDPVGLSDGASYFSWVDFSLDTYAGRIEFQRSYTSNDQLWGQAGDLAGIARPFGSSWTDPQSTNWSHSFFSFVVERTSAGQPATWTVRRRDGSILQFDGCTPTTGCFATPRGESLEADAKLYRSGGTFTLYESGRRSVFAVQDGSRWFLKAIASDEFTPASSRWLVQDVAYAAPPSLCPGATGRYVNAATLGDGRILRFSYALRSANGGASSQCVLTGVNLESAAGTTALVTYWYSGGAAGRISDVRFIDGSSQHFDYPSASSPVNGTFRVSRNDSILLEHDVVAGRVQTIRESVDGSQLRKTWSLSAPSGCAPLTSCTTATARNLFVGDGSGTPTTQAWAAAARSVSWSGVPRTSSWSAGVATDTWSWREWPGTGGGGGSTLLAVTPDRIENSVGVSTTYDWQTASSPQSRELQATTDALGRRTEFDFIAGDSNRTPSGVAQLQTVERRPSVLNVQGFARTITNWDSANNRITSVVRAGWTWRFTPPSTWAPVERYVATFYRTDAPALSLPPDPRGRIQQVDGPCFVNSPTASACNSDAPWEVVAYEYGNTPGLDQDRIVAVSRFPNVVLPPSSSQPTWGRKLRTRFGNYDAFGHPGQSVDPNGVTTDFVWTDGRLQQATVRDANGVVGSWDYLYDLDKLTAVRDPDGAWTVWCYRDSFDRTGGCNYSSAFSPVVRAHAIAPEPSGAGYTEAAVFEYGLDGRLRRTAYLDESGERRSQTEERDPFGNPTYSRSGDRPGSLNRTTRLFDSAGRLRALGEPFASAPDFCGGFDTSGNPASALCSAFLYDKADRLTAVTGSCPVKWCTAFAPSGVTSTRTSSSAQRCA